MKSLICHALIRGICILAVVLFAHTGLEGLPNPACEDGVEFQIVTDRPSYAPGATMHVKFLITNTDKAPLYLLRGMGQCSSPYGSLALDIRDQRNHEVKPLRCFVDPVLMHSQDIIDALNNPQTGVMLEEGQIYGQERDYVLPTKKGTYQLHAKLAQLGILSDDLKEALAQHHMRVLRSTCSAPAVTITVK
jgi:hypothetical protein